MVAARRISAIRRRPTLPIGAAEFTDIHRAVYAYGVEQPPQFERGLVFSRLLNAIGARAMHFAAHKKMRHEYRARSTRPRAYDWSSFVG
jgi:hypothetical protein